MAAPIVSNCVGETLERLLVEAREGRLQIPEFQRALSLQDEWIKSLLASVSLGYSIGAVTLLEAGNPALRFTARPVAGTTPSGKAPERLLIDGQARITALYQVLASGRGRAVDRCYYLDIDAAVDPGADRDEAVISVLAAHPVEVEWAQHLFPLALVFNADADLRQWLRGFDDREVIERFEAEVLEAIRGYVLPTIVVGKEWTRWSVRVHGGPNGPSLSDRFRV